MNIHEVAPAVRGICRLLFSNHDVTLSDGAIISNCLSAMARHIREGSLVEAMAIRGDDPPPEPLPSVSEPPVATLPDPDGDGDGDSHPNLPARFDPGSAPLLVRLEGEASMAPYAEFDESRVNVAGNRVMVLVLRTPDLAITRIAPDRAGDTIGRLFWMAPDRPLVAGSYRGGGAFRGDYQTCIIHVWRKTESLAVTHGIDPPRRPTAGCCRTSMMPPGRRPPPSPGWPAVLRTRPAGWDCQPGWFPTWPISPPHPRPIWATASPRWSRRTARWRSAIRTRARSADTLENAAPHMPGVIGHPGMPGNTNNIERTIRVYVVRPRNIQRILPDWEAARTLEMLQTVHATCRIRGTFSGDVVAGNRGCWAFGSGKPPPVSGIIH